MKKKFSPSIFRYLIIVLTIHIFAVLSGLLHNLNGKNESLWMAITFAASYAVASGFIVFLANQKWLILCYALFDAVGVLYYYFPAIPQAYIAVYFAIYTFALIASTIYLTSDPVNEIVTMKKAGKLLKDIAATMNTTEYKVSKTLKETENES